jgi:hypothetical protein
MEINYNGLLKMVSLQNDKIVNEINEIEDRYTTDDQIVNYKNEQSEWVQSANRMLIYLYYLMVAILLYLLLKKKVSTLNNNIEIFLYNILNYIWTFIMCSEYQD